MRIPALLFASLALAPVRQPSAMSQAATPAFRFHLAISAQRPPGQQVWDAVVKPEGVTDSIPTTFRLSLSVPTLAAPPGTRIHAELSRGDAGGMEFFAPMFGETFDPSVASGRMMGFAIEPANSVQLSLTVQGSGSGQPWTAFADRANGGQFSVAIDSVHGWGEFRSVDHRYHVQVLMAIMALAAPRQ